MTHEVKDFSSLLGTLEGISDSQLEQHFTLYGGYVKKLNEIEEKLSSIDKSASNYSFNEFSELKRREAVAFNGSYLHQLYFENLNGSETKPSEALQVAVNDSFGSCEAMEAEMKAAAGATPGWVLLSRNRIDGKLHTYIMYEHHIGLPAHQDIIVALDCWEHAFMIDYGIKKPDYLAAFMKNVDWEVASERFAACV